MQTSTPANSIRHAVEPSHGRFAAPPRQMRFLAIWIALAFLVAVCAVLLPRSVAPSTIQTILPFVAFLALASMGQAIVLMGRGIDLSVPGTVGLASAVLLGVSGGSDDRLWIAIIAALLAAAAVGTVNGILVAVLKLNALIVTLAVGAIVSGITLWYRQAFTAEAKVPESLAAFGSSRLLGLPVSVWIALVVLAILAVGLRKTILGRRFELVGANPRAAYAAGIEIMRYQAGAFILASVLYGILAVLLSGFIRNPTLEVGNPYLLAPIAAAVLGGTAISGGIGSMLAVTGAAIFLMQLDQALKMIGLPTSWQLIIQGCAIAAGMWLSEFSNRSRRRG
jgi:ribose transport system permease protein